MKRYQMIAAAGLAAMMLGGCSKTAETKPGSEPAEVTTEAVEKQTEPIRIQTHETEASREQAEETEAVPETTAAAKETTAAVKETKAPAETEAPKVYSVSAFEKTMYATQPVHVRASYTKQSDVLTSLGSGQKVEVTGQAANGWYRIVYNGRDAYVYKAYLTEKKASEHKESEHKDSQKPKPQPPKETVPETTAAPAETAPVTIIPSPNSGISYGPGGSAAGPGVSDGPGSTNSNQYHYSYGNGSNNSSNTIPGLQPGQTTGPAGPAGETNTGKGTAIITGIGPGM